MNKPNQILLTVCLVGASLYLYFQVGSFILNAIADRDCMALEIPHAQVIGLTTYCGGVYNGSDTYREISKIREYLDILGK